jgi:predicted transcriptional regulator
MDEGYIISNKFRRIIFDELSSGGKNIDRIAKKNRIIKTIAYRIINDFKDNGIVEKKGNIYLLTEEGEKLAAKING